MKDDPLIQKVRRAVSAFSRSASDDLSRIKILYEEGPNFKSVRFDPNEGVPSVELHNEISLILTAVGSLKDHVNAFCKAKGLRKIGDEIIDRNREVALIHDLWNVDKHYELSRPPRSGITPHLRHVSRMMMVSASGPNAVSSFSFNPATGQVETQGSVELVLSAMIFDETGTFVADFRATCDKAIECWISEVGKLGVDLGGPSTP